MSAGINNHVPRFTEKRYKYIYLEKKLRMRNKQVKIYAVGNRERNQLSILIFVQSKSCVLPWQIFSPYISDSHFLFSVLKF